MSVKAVGKHSFLLILSWVAFSAFAWAQYPQYRFPMEGNDFLISGTFGELRPAHFHTGLDVKTEGMVGKPLMAVADGYVFRIQVSPDSYGNALYIRHRDGNISVYAHLSKYAPAIESRLYQRQYTTKRWEQDIYLDQDDIPVKAGQLLAFSGNSGHSMGPHLHLEIRDEEDYVLNPMAFFRHLIRDDVPPVLQRISLQPLDASARVGGRFQKQEFQLDGKPGYYVVPGVVEISGRVGLEYQAYDLLSGAANPCGINFAKLFLDGKLIFEYHLDRFKWDDKKDIDVHFDYAHYLHTGRRLERAYVNPWHKFEAYRNVVNEGAIELQDDKEHDLRLELRDLHGNLTTCSLRLRKGGASNIPKELSFSDITSVDGYFVGGVFVGRVQNPSTRHLYGMQAQFPMLKDLTIRPAWFEGNSLYFVMDISGEEMPPRAFVDPITGKRVDFDFAEMIHTDRGVVAEEDGFSAFFPAGSSYFNFPLSVKRQTRPDRACSDAWTLGWEDVPLRSAIKVGFDPHPSIRPEHLFVAQKTKNGDWVHIGNEKGDDGRIYADATTMGTFCLMADSTAPSIRPMNFSEGGQIPERQQEILIEVLDNLTKVNPKRIHVTLDGQWMLFAYDRKTNSLAHTIWRRPTPGKHEIEVMVFDNANNLGSRRFIVYF